MSGAQLRMARAALCWSVRDLAREARVSAVSITRLEANLSARPSTVTTIRETLARAGWHTSLSLILSVQSNDT